MTKREVQGFSTVFSPPSLRRQGRATMSNGQKPGSVKGAQPRRLRSGNNWGQTPIVSMLGVLA